MTSSLTVPSPRTRRSKPRPFVRGFHAVDLLENRYLLTFDLQLPTLNMTAEVADPSKVLVQFAPEAGSPEALAQSLAEETPWILEVEDLGLGLWQVQTAEGVELNKAVEILSAEPTIALAEPDFAIQLASTVTPNDPGYSYLYGLEALDLPETWGTYSTSADSVVVAVIDTGIDLDHPDLVDNLWVNPGEIAGNGIDDDGNGFVDDVHGYDFANNDSDPDDGNGHGTHVAGTIGAVGNNGTGVAGVAWDVQLMALKFLGDNGSGSTSAAIQSIYYAVNNGATISNNSWGGPGYSNSLRAAIQYAANEDHIFVAAAGNNGENTDTFNNYPSNYNVSNVISVGAVNDQGQLASFSNYGISSVDLVAPGVNIVSTYRNGQYASLSGTSMAAPHVAGVLALYRAANPGLTYDQVIADLLGSVEPIPELANLIGTGGQVNAANLFEQSSGGGADTQSPTILSAEPIGQSANQVDQVLIEFSEAINPGTFTPADVSLTHSDGQGVWVQSVSPIDGSNTRFAIQVDPISQVGTYQVVVDSAVADLAGNVMAKDYITQFVISSELVYESTDSVNIWDLQPVFSSITVDDSFAIGSIKVKLDIDHTYTSDLVISLIAPNGERADLAWRVGGSGNHFEGTLLDPDAGTPLSQGEAPFDGTYRPHQRMRKFLGDDAQGTWSLRVADKALWDWGRVNSWSLILEPASSSASNSSTAELVAFGPQTPEVIDPSVSLPDPSTTISDPVPPSAAVFRSPFVSGPPSGSGPVQPFVPATQAATSVAMIALAEFASEPGGSDPLGIHSSEDENDLGLSGS